MVCRFDKAAARRAGYSPRSARWAAHRLMRDPRVKALLAPPTPPAGRDIPDDKETGTWALARLLRFSDLRLEGHLEGIYQGQTALLTHKPKVLLELAARRKQELGWAGLGGVRRPAG